MNYNDLMQKYYNKKFITTFIIIFIILYLLTTFVKFLGQLPILLVITFIISIYFTKNSSILPPIIQTQYQDS
jgi:hypothetical protein